MPALFLGLAIVCATMQNFFAKIFTSKTNKGIFLFNAISTFVAVFVFFCMAKFRIVFIWENFLYSILLAVSYFFAVFGLTMAIKTGSLFVSSLIDSYSMIISLIYGIFFLDEPITAFMIVGFILLVVSIFFINYNPKEKTENNTKKFNFKWLIFISLAFVGNGFFTVVKKMQQIWSENTYGEGEFLYSNDMMVIGLILTAIAFLICSLICERKDIGEVIKKGLAPAIGRGLCNGCANLFSIFVLAMLPVSLASPIIAVGCVILIAVLSTIVYREKLNLWQYIGIVAGVISLVLLNI